MLTLLPADYNFFARGLQKPLDKAPSPSYNTKAVRNRGRNLGV